MNLKRLVNYENPNSFASKLRKKRAHYLESIVSRIAETNGGCRILDLGGTYSYWKIFEGSRLEDLDIEIALLNLDDIPAPERMSRRFQCIKGDACDLTIFNDGAFDLVHSNSVIEHVGGWERMQAMAHESARVGKNVYLQTPYFWFPIEPHFLTPFLHWLPLSTRSWIACRFALGNWPRARSFDEAIKAQLSSALLDKRMVESLMPKAEIHFERVLGFPKSLIAIQRENE
jgi:ubiquinone/menaquinone biosynthesis C-methylase UbiE